jgi:hypothetical protein
VSEDNRLLRSGKPKADESLMGYIIRLTEQNGYSSSSWIILSAGLTSKINRFCLFVCGPPESFRDLASYTGTTTSELSSATYDYHTFYGFPVPASSIRFGDPKVCPACLSESLYCRRIWDLCAVTVCSRHKCLLMDQCPNCMEPISWLRNRVSVCRCEFDWREAEVRPVATSEMALTCHVHDLCGLPVDASIFRSQFHQSPFMNLMLGNLLLVLFFLAGLYKGVSISTGRHLLPRGRNSDFHALLTNTYSVFEDWPNNFYQFLRWWSERQRKVPLIRNRLKSTLYRDFGKFYIGLYSVLADRQFDFLRDAFLDYLLGEWDGGDLPSAQKQNTGKHLTDKYVLKSDAVRLLSSDKRQVTLLIKTGRLTTEVRSKGMKRLIFVDVADIAELLAELR